jgi:hypothetical protein
MISSPQFYKTRRRGKKYGEWTFLMTKVITSHTCWFVVKSHKVTLLYAEAVAFCPGDDCLYCVGNAPGSKVNLVTWDAPKHSPDEHSSTNKH